MTNTAKKAEPPRTGTALVPKQQRHRAQTTPVNLKKLCDRIGVPAVATRLGYSESSIYTMVTNNNCVKVVEVAATLMLQEDGGAKTNLYMVKVPDGSRESVETMLNAFDCKFRHFID